jgi:hypothetical protein
MFEDVEHVEHVENVAKCKNAILKKNANEQGGLIDTI